MVGQNIGKYRVADRVGRGGMGTVYRAMDETLHREVAIKVLNAELNDPEVAKRFRAEAITVARLSHPGIATIYELFQHEGQWLMVMEFVRGETLEHMVERMGPLSPQRAAELSMQALGALAHAHSMGVVHRDLKPANLMITETGAIKIMDFGIARVSGTEHLTSAGFMMGTPAYMAPEQVMGQEIDARADLYAIGVVFYRLTTAKLPFKGETPFSMAQSQVNEPPLPIGAIRNDLPPWVDQIVVRALAKAPVERFQSAIEFHEAFARCLAGLPMATQYNSSAPTELMPTPSRAMPSGTIQRPMTSGAIPGYTGPISVQTPGGLPGPSGTSALPGAETRVSDRTPAHPSAAVPVGAMDDGALSSAHLPTVGPVLTPIRGTALGEQPPSSRTSALEADARSPGVRPARKSGSSTALIAAAVVLLAVGAGAYFMLRPRPPAEPPIAAAPAVTEPPVVTEPVAPVPPSPTAAAPAPIPAPTSTVSPVEPDAGVAAPIDLAARGRGAAPGAVAAVGTAPGAALPGGRRGGAPIEDGQLAFTDVKVLLVDGRRARDEDIVLTFGGGQLTFLGRRGGNALAAVPYRAVASATYARARNPKWDAAFPAPPADLDVPGGFLRTAKHWLTLQTKDGFFILQLQGGNWMRILESVEARTGVAVERSRQTDD